MEKRQAFRITDTIPLILEKKPVANGALKAKLIEGGLQSLFAPTSDEADPKIDPALLRMLTVIDSKLNLILERLSAQNNGLTFAENHQVNLSEMGICLVTSAPLAEGDVVEIKLMLPAFPYSCLLVYGKVQRVNQLTEQDIEAAIEFVEMEDNVRDVLSRYILHRQRVMLRSQQECLPGEQ
jgi:hypothetical protein